jgi:hypothetical protein
MPARLPSCIGIVLVILVAGCTRQPAAEDTAAEPAAELAAEATAEPAAPMAAPMVAEPARHAEIDRNRGARDVERIGVALRTGVRREELAARLPPGLALVEDPWREFEVLASTDGADRDALTRLARELSRTSADLISHAGFLATEHATDEPHLVTHEVVVRLGESIDSEAARDALCEELGLTVVRASAFDRRLLVVVARDEHHVDALELAERLVGKRGIVYAEPNVVHDTTRTAPLVDDDPLFDWQWHLHNTGQSGGTADADIDAPEAWALTRGAPEVVIAVLENGFDAEHPDFLLNLWSAEGNDQLHGWDFEDGDATLIGDPADPDATAHGTSVAGCAAARGNNGLGGSGSCPECRMMLLRISDPTNAFDDAEAFRYAWHNGASIISNSWTYAWGKQVPQVVREAVKEAATKGRNGKGCVILFAVRNEQKALDGSGDIATLPEVIAVGAVANTDEHVHTCGYGACLSILGPTRLNQAPNPTAGTLDVTPTDWQGPAGYNADPSPAIETDSPVDWPLPPEVPNNPDYTARFGGTSAATPIVAGVVGLILTAEPELTAEQVRRLLQDTADRVQDSQALYSPVDGRCPGGTHGYGRVNAFEAVRVVAPIEPGGGGGSGGVDLFVRDHRLDWGNTAEPSDTRFENVRGVIGAWSSPDVKVDAPPLEPTPASSSAFRAFTDEAPVAGVVNRVYVRVRNRGIRTAAAGTARAAFCPDGSALPPWSWAAAGSPGGNAGWHDLPPVSLAAVPPSGASLAGQVGDAAVILSFDFTPTGAAGEGIALLVAVDSPDDPFDAPGAAQSPWPGTRVPRDNDLAVRGLRLAGVTADGPPSVLVRNPSDGPLTCRLEVLVPKGKVATLQAAPAGGVFATGEVPVIEQTDTAGRNLSSEFTLAAGAEGTLSVLLAPAPTGTPDPPVPPSADKYYAPAPPDAAPPDCIEVRQWRVTATGRELLGGLDIPIASGS